MKTFHLDLYDKIKYKQLSPQDLLNKLTEVYRSKINDDDVRMFTYTEAILALFYNNYYRSVDYKSNLTEYNQGKLSLLIKPLTGSEESFLRILESFQHRNFDSLPIDYLINKIDLIENVIT